MLDAITLARPFQRHIKPDNLLAHGTLTITPQQRHRYLYTEQGQYQQRGQQRRFTQQRHLYYDGKILRIINPFTNITLHHFRLPATYRFPLTLHSCYPCAADRYILSLTFATPRDCHLCYAIEGPQKHYQIDTYFTLL